MKEGTTVEAEVIRLRQSIETQMRRRILEAIEVVLEEELTEALGTGRYERGECMSSDLLGHLDRSSWREFSPPFAARPRCVDSLSFFVPTSSA